MTPVVLDLLLATVPFLAVSVVTWRLVWPRWKLLGKAAAYFGVVAALSGWIGHWSVLLAFVHQGVGLAFHVAFCRTHGFTWYAVEDPARYVELSKAMVGISPADSGPQRSVDRIALPENIAMQCEGEKPAIEWVMPEDDPDR